MVDVDLEGNPTICGCSSRFSEETCIKVKVDGSSSLSTQPACLTSRSDCSFPSVKVTSRKMEGASYRVSLRFSTGDLEATLYKYIGLGTESVSVTAVRSFDVSAEAAKPVKADLVKDQNYTVCFYPAGNDHMTSCQYINQPRFSSVKSGSASAVPVDGMLTVTAFAQLLLYRYCL